MWENVIIGLQLTIYGTGLVFLVLAFLWGLMSLLLRFDQGEPLQSPVQGAEKPEEAGRLSAREQAAVALAVLRYRRERMAAGRWPSPIVSASSWVGAGRARQLRPSISFRRRSR